VGCLDAQEVSGPGAFTSALKNRFASGGEEILRELAKLNPEDPRAELWKNV
jgi:hypothetical protein